jgi:hypothetical protein
MGRPRNERPSRTNEGLAAAKRRYRVLFENSTLDRDAFSELLETLYEHKLENHRITRLDNLRIEKQARLDHIPGPQASGCVCGFFGLPATSLGGWICNNISMPSAQLNRSIYAGPFHIKCGLPRPLSGSPFDQICSHT